MLQAYLLTNKLIHDVSIEKNLSTVWSHSCKKQKYIYLRFLKFGVMCQMQTELSVEGKIKSELSIILHM